MGRDIKTIDWAAVIVKACKRTAAAARPKMSIVTPVAAQLPDVFTRLEINTPRRQAHFLAQAIIECDYFKTLTEYASGDAYDQRTDMGFTAAKDGDGRINKGFGIFQTTGPNNQRRALAELVKLGFRVPQDVSQARTTLTNPMYAAWVAGIFWRDNKLNAIADRDADGSLCSRQVNRGNWRSTKKANHEADRLRAFRAAWAVLQKPPLLPVGVPMALLDAEAPEADPEAEEMAAHLGRLPVLPAHAGPDDLPGEDSDDGAELSDMAPSPGSPPVPLPAEPVAPGVPDGLMQAAQQRLRALGYYLVGNPDGDAGGRSVAALAMFQHTAELPVTGQLDTATLHALYEDDAPHAPVSVDRAMATARDLKEQGSTIVDATMKTKAASAWQMIAGGVTAAGTAVVSGFSDTMATLANVRHMFADIPGWVWAGAAVMIIAGPALISYVQARRAEKARVEDYQTGKVS